MLAFYSDDPSLNPAGYINFLFEKAKINEKEAGIGPSLEKNYTTSAIYASVAQLFTLYNGTDISELLVSTLQPYTWLIQGSNPGS